MSYIKKIENYYNDLYLETKHIELIENRNFRRNVLQNIDLRDSDIKIILTIFTGLNNLQTLSLYTNRVHLVEFISTSDLPRHHQRFLLNFEDDLNLFLPMGYRNCSRNKDNSEEMKYMIIEVLNSLVTVGLILNVLIQTQANETERKKFEISQSELLISRQLKNEGFDLERERLEFLKKKIKIIIDKKDYDFDRMY